MKVSQNCPNTAFASKLYPIKSFKINTKNGELKIEDISLKNIESSNLSEEIADFFCDNFKYDTNDPFWLSMNKQENRFLLEDVKNTMASHILSGITNDDGNLNLLIAKDKNKNIKAALFAHGYYILPEVRNKLYYIDSLAVDNAYRKNGVAQVLMEQTLDSASKSGFSDVFINGEKMAYNFYEGLGFCKLNPDNNNQKAFIDYMEYKEPGNELYRDLLTKPLDNDAKRWYDVFHENILLQLEKAMESAHRIFL